MTEDTATQPTAPHGRGWSTRRRRQPADDGYPPHPQESLAPRKVAARRSVPAEPILTDNGEEAAVAKVVKPRVRKAAAPRTAKAKGKAAAPEETTVAVPAHEPVKAPEAAAPSGEGQPQRDVHPFSRNVGGSLPHPRPRTAGPRRGKARAGPPGGSAGHLHRGGGESGGDGDSARHPEAFRAGVARRPGTVPCGTRRSAHRSRGAVAFGRGQSGGTRSDGCPRCLPEWSRQPGQLPVSRPSKPAVPAGRSIRAARTLQPAGPPRTAGPARPLLAGRRPGRQSPGRPAGRSTRLPGSRPARSAGPGPGSA